MSTNASSAELTAAKAISDSKIASTTDRHLGNLRREANAHAASKAQYTFEDNMRQAANLEIGRSRNLSRVV